MQYLRDPEAIYSLSFKTIREEADLTSLNADEADIAVRVIHACGMCEVGADLRFGGDVAACARAALSVGRPILVDTTMVGAAIISRHLPDGVEIICTLNDADVASRAAAQKTTRTAAAVDLWEPHLADAVVIIGNAPTALFRLLEMIDEGVPKPAALFAFPVGFVGAAESKDALIADPRGLDYVTLPGRRGGSAMAGAALNAVIAAGSGR